jgi:phage tail-like protein
MALTDKRDIDDDPYASFRFTAEIDGIKAIGFSDVTGLTLESNVETFREGGVNTHEWQLTGPTKFPSRIILKRGLADAEELWSWYQEVMSGSIKRKNVTITLLDYAAYQQWQWVFREACPVKWSGPELRAGTAAVAFESIELVHRGLEPSPRSGRRRDGVYGLEP